MKVVEKSRNNMVLRDLSYGDVFMDTADNDDIMMVVKHPSLTNTKNRCIVRLTDGEAFIVADTRTVLPIDGEFVSRG